MILAEIEGPVVRGSFLGYYSKKPASAATAQAGI
jgi:hypothetical protein